MDGTKPEEPCLPDNKDLCQVAATLAAAGPPATMGGDRLDLFWLHYRKLIATRDIHQRRYKDSLELYEWRGSEDFARLQNWGQHLEEVLPQDLSKNYRGRLLAEVRSLIYEGKLRGLTEADLRLHFSPGSKGLGVLLQVHMEAMFEGDQCPL